MAKRTRRRRIDVVTVSVAVLGVLVFVALAALQLTGGGTRPGAASLTTDDVQRITPQEARDLVAEGGATLFDVRSEQEYIQAHAEGAYHLPAAEAAQFASTLPDEGALIFI